LTFLIAHLSDPHIGPLPKIPFVRLLNKRLTGALNWHGSRATIHNMDSLDAILHDLMAQNPDHVALTGDLVNLGYGPEFPQALARIAPLGDPGRVSIVPGNHDAYTGGSLPEMQRVFGAFMRHDEPGDEPDDTAPAPEGFPYLRRRGGIALIGVNSGVPTLPFMATGRVGTVQRMRLARLLDKTGREGLFRVVMIHHPPLRAAARFARGLDDAEDFTALLARHGAELVLHGHNHRHARHSLPSPTGPIPVLGVASASAVPGTPHHHAEYHLIRIDRATGGLTVSRRGFHHGGNGIETLEIFHLPPRTP
jgi:3',5'-cyclic AMP phosphodiesterase CpdA